MVFEKDDMKAELFLKDGWKTNEDEYGLQFIKKTGGTHTIPLPSMHGKLAMVLSKNQLSHEDLILFKSRSLGSYGFIFHQYNMRIEGRSVFGNLTKMSHDDWATFCHDDTVPALNDDRLLGFHWGINEEPYKEVILPAIISNVRTDTYSEDYSTTRVPVALYNKFEEALVNRSSNCDFQFINNVVNKVFNDYSLRNRIEFTLLGMVLVNSIMDKSMINKARGLLGVNSNKFENKVDSIWLSQNKEIWDKVKYLPENSTTAFQMVILLLFLTVRTELFIVFSLGLIALIHWDIDEKNKTLIFLQLFEVIVGAIIPTLLFTMIFTIFMCHLFKQRLLPVSRLPKINIREVPKGSNGINVKWYKKPPPEKMENEMRILRDTNNYIKLNEAGVEGGDPSLIPEAKGSAMKPQNPILFQDGCDRTQR